MPASTIITVAPFGADVANIPTGPQLSAIWEVRAPDGSRAIFNDPNDVDYVGVLTDATGFDSPEIREAAEDLVQMDGGIHGDFFYGRRPLTMEGMILNPASAMDRNVRMNKLTKACRALRQDATISWTLDGGYKQFVKVRLQNGPRYAGQWQKTFQVGMVAEDPRIYSDTLYARTVAAGGVAEITDRSYDKRYDYGYGAGQITGQLVLANNGNALSWPVITVFGPGVNPTVTNATTGESIKVIYTLGASEYLVIDTNPLFRGVLLNNQASRYSAIDFLNTEWWGLAPGLNDTRLTFSSFSTGAAMTISYRDAWL